MPLPFQTAGELFRELPDAERRRISSILTGRQYPRETVLFYEDGPGDSLYIVRKGLVKLVSSSERGTDTILHILRAGDVFGELLLVEGRRPFTAIAMTDVLADRLGRKDFLEVLSACPAFAANYARLLTLRLMQVEREFSGMVHAWSWHRLAKELLHLAEELGEDTRAGTRIAWKLTHEDLANLIGTARETVTIQLHKFEELGLIRREGRNLIVDRARLRDYVSVREA
ncbi:MAG TPA: Crp/Fnr family transcriptional regulator [Candidatus Aquicultoraceae bacterium]|nr:Crp/Fnr family transcriptional regulator [Candidatus Aquicultoraceae bacterium]